jgi:hypothetical protein
VATRAVRHELGLSRRVPGPGRDIARRWGEPGKHLGALAPEAWYADDYQTVRLELAHRACHPDDGRMRHDAAVGHGGCYLAGRRPGSPSGLWQAGDDPDALRGWHGVHMDKVGGRCCHEPGWSGTASRSDPCARREVDTGIVQDLSDSGGRDLVAKPGEFTWNPPVPRRGVLRRDTDHELSDWRLATRCLTDPPQGRRPGRRCGPHKTGPELSGVAPAGTAPLSAMSPG